MRNLQSMSIEFQTLGYSEGVVAHVFVKNHRGDTGSSSGPDSFVSNLLAFQAAEASPVPPGTNPFLGSLLSAHIAMPVPGLNPNPQTVWDIPLRSQVILADEVLLPVVHIHLYTPTTAWWRFTFTLTMQFEEGGTLTYSPSDDGVESILLHNNAPDYAALCKEANTLPRWVTPNDVSLTSVTVEFFTHGDSKAANTAVNLHIANRVSATESADIVVAEGLFAGEQLKPPQPKGLWTNLKEFPSGTSVTFSHEASDLPLAGYQMGLTEIVLPVVGIVAVPGAEAPFPTDLRWTFDYQVTYAFSNGMRFVSQTNNVCLDPTSTKHVGGYNGPAFPTSPPEEPNAGVSAVLTPGKTKSIPLALVRKKVGDLLTSTDQPFVKLALGNVGDFGVGQRRSFYQIKTRAASPPPPGSLSVPGYQEGVVWNGSPTDLGFIANSVYFPPIQSTKIEIDLLNDNTTVDLPITVKITFENDFDVPWAAYSLSGWMEVKDFWIQLKLSFTVDPNSKGIDVLHWVDELNNLSWTQDGINWNYSGTFRGQPISGLTVNPSQLIESLYEQALHVDFTTFGTLDPGGTAQKQMREQIWGMLSTTDPITGKTAADKLNELISSWLLGGPASTGFAVESATVDPVGDSFNMTYTEVSYPLRPPAAWPGATDFRADALASIEHIVVLMKENRSFDHMLGYLSLPVEAGGQARTDIDGLKGHEWNPLDGRPCFSFPFEPEDTVFSPNPPQDHDRVVRQISLGAMDGFAAAYRDEANAYVAPRIMGYHTGRTVPVYDALARDFAICHRWFASYPGPTFPNRYYTLAGHPAIDPHGNWETDDRSTWAELNYSAHFVPAVIDTIFDHLPDTVSWKYFENGDYGMLRMCTGHTFDTDHIVPFIDTNAPANGFLALAKSGNLPNVSFVDPHFIDDAPGATCDEPPSDVRPGQDFVRQIVEALVASPAWEKTLLIITYDEHGGFYDHVPPPQAQPPQPVVPGTPSTYGLRVPTIIVSPWVRPGSSFGYDGPVVTPANPVVAAAPAPGAPSAGATSDPPAPHRSGYTGAAAAIHLHPPTGSLHFDHTSILKTIVRCFLPYDPASPVSATNPIPPYLGDRYAAANDLSMIMTAAPHLPAFRPFIPYTFVYRATQKALEVPNGNPAPGALLWLNAPSLDFSSEQQYFRLEDAGNGFWYLRAPAGNLYLTADPNMNLIQDLRYGAGDVAGDPKTQQWQFTVSPVDPNAAFTITNAAYSTNTLQPAGNGPYLVLGTPQTAGQGNAWTVISPRLL